MTPRGLIIAAAHSGAGKTTVTMAILAALQRRGVAVRAAKAGPDYIDPAFHAAATRSPSINLDSWAMSRPLLDAMAAQSATGADIAWACRRGGELATRRLLSEGAPARFRGSFACGAALERPAGT